jgi:AcrR family transcriptional regulator
MSAKRKILNAAACVVDRAGAAHLTIDAVAAEAKLSKGGVLYHFPTKRAMLEGMVQHVLDRTHDRVVRHRATLQDAPNATVRALIKSEQEQDEPERAMSLAILAAAAEDPSLLEPARAAVAEWFASVADEGRLGVLLLLATEGLRFLSMLNLLPMGDAERAAVHQSMLRIAEEG